jgi:hypothetical protein
LSGSTHPTIGGFNPTMEALAFWRANAIVNR